MQFISVKGNNNIGGIIGLNESDTVRECVVDSCSSDGTIEGHDCVGGIIGFNNGGNYDYPSLSFEGTVTADSSGHKGDIIGMELE